MAWLQVDWSSLCSRTLFGLLLRKAAAGRPDVRFSLYCNIAVPRHADWLYLLADAVISGRNRWGLGMERQTFTTGTPWEPIVGYSRAVRVGQHVFVSGTTATDANGNVVGIGDPRAQTIQALQNIANAL